MHRTPMRRLAVTIALLLAGVALVSTSTPASGQSPIDDKREEARQVAARLDELTARYSRLSDRANEAEANLIRIGSAIGKYWICKRTPGVAAEAMECIGGSGVMEDGPMPRIFRESPVNAIWEGSGNVQCLDVLRALSRTPETLAVYFAEVEAANGANAAYDRHVAALKEDMRETDDFEMRARDLVDRLAVAFQASVLVRHAPAFVSDAYCASRMESRGAHQYGALPKGVDCKAIVTRARAR